MFWLFGISEKNIISIKHNIKLSINFLLGLLLYISCGICGIALVSNIQNYKTNTILLLFAIILIGLHLCKKTEHAYKIKIPYFKILWPIKLTITLFLLHYGWLPDLEKTSSNNWGYDPQRYYSGALNLIENNFSSQDLEPTYQGIIYFYAIQFYIFGANPYIAALTNSLITLGSILFIVIFLLKLNLANSKNLNYISAFLFLPELLWYDALTSRESVCSALIFSTSILSYGLCIQACKKKIAIKILSLFVLLFLLLSIRATLLVPWIFGLLLIFFLTKPTNINAKIIRIFFTILALLSMVFVPYMHSNLGYEVNLIKVIKSLYGSSENIAENVQWNEKSIGQLILPKNALQALVYTPVRFVLYLAAPLPQINFSLNGLLEGRWDNYQSLILTASSFLMIIFFPISILGSLYCWKNRNNNNCLLILPISYFSYAVAVASGNLIIDVRYRLTFLLLFYSCAWIGIIFGKINQAVILYVLWFLALAFILLAYLIIKL